VIGISKKDTPTTSWRKTPLPPHTKSAVFLNPANPPTLHTYGMGAGQGDWSECLGYTGRPRLP